MGHEVWVRVVGLQWLERQGLGSCGEMVFFLTRVILCGWVFSALPPCCFLICFSFLAMSPQTSTIHLLPTAYPSILT